MDLLVDVELRNVNGLPKDSVHNAWVIQTVAPVEDPDDALDYVVHFQQMYSGFATNLLNGVVKRGANAVNYSVYDLAGHLDGSDHGSPMFSMDFELPPPQPDAHVVPTEVSMVLTLYGQGRATAPVEGEGITRPKQRRTGRIYLGPLLATTMAIVDGQTRFTNSSCEDVIDAVQLLRTNLALETNGAQVMVWSRRDVAVRPVVGGHVDNAPDTQRRRGVDPSARLSFAP